MIYICGLDPSSEKLAVTITKLENPPGDIDMRTAKLGSHIVNRSVLAYNFMEEIIQDYRFEDLRVFIEAPVLGRGGARATIPQARVNGALLAALGHNDVFFHDVNNTSWKKVVLGKGSGIDKSWIAAKMAEIWPTATQQANGDQDLIDSAAINRYGVIITDKAIKLEHRRTTKNHVKRRVTT